MKPDTNYDLTLNRVVGMLMHLRLLTIRDEDVVDAIDRTITEVSELQDDLSDLMDEADD